MFVELGFVARAQNSVAKLQATNPERAKKRVLLCSKVRPP